jgi:cellulose 1,4-beta-cellobiosidase
MLWLDSTYPTDSTALGSQRGSCSTSSGVPADLEKNVPNSKVAFSNIKFGPIGSTYNKEGTQPQPTNPTNPNPTNPTNPGTVDQWGQCGGTNYSGPTACKSPFTCKKINDFYYQCQ